MRASRIIPVVLVLAAIVAAGIYFLRPAAPPPPPPGPTVSAPAPTPPPSAHYEVPATSEPLPALKDSDVAVLEALRGLLGPDAIARMVVPETIIRNFVATVDNLPREQISQRVNPVRAVGGAFKARGRDQALAIAPENAARYNAYVTAFEKMDTPSAVALYVRLYPLLQQAYVELGYPNGYFNDRLVEVIDHLLDAPEPKTPPRLTTPHVLYEYADPDLESRSAGQKIMMRIGLENEARVKAKLRELRKELVAKAPAR